MSILPPTDATLQQPITAKAQLVAHHASGEKTKENFLIGTEHEKFVLDGENRVVPYASIHALLTGMQRFGFAPIMEGETLIGLTRGRENISLEPAGQYELSGAPLTTLHAMASELDQHLAESKSVAEGLGLRFLPIAYHPTATPGSLPWMPKGRYAIMRDYMPKKGKRGHEMMQHTCTTQVNLDYSSEADMVRKMRVSMALQPIVSALFANSPFQYSKPSPDRSTRCAVWLDVDPDRSGILPFVFEAGFGYERYVDYALDVPMYFVYRAGRYINCAGQSFRAFLEGKLPALPGEKPRMEDWLNHLTTLFPEVRLKTYLEMRGADVGDVGMIKALPALWVGLLYDDQALSQAESLVQGWTVAAMQDLRRAVPRHALAATIGGQSALTIAKQLVTLATQGLRRRALRLESGADETRYLAPLQSIVAVEQTEAEHLLDLYQGDWGCDINRVFAARCL